MDQELIKTLLSTFGAGGALGALALIVLNWKRADDTRYATNLDNYRREALEQGRLTNEALNAVASALLSLKNTVEEQGRTDDTLTRLETQMRELVKESRKRNGEEKT